MKLGTQKEKGMLFSFLQSFFLFLCQVSKNINFEG